MDHRAPASLYLVSDSRYTHLQRKASDPLKIFTDEGRKIYACSKESHLFGFVGYVGFAAPTLRTLKNVIDEGQFFSDHETANDCGKKVAQFLEVKLAARLLVGSVAQAFAFSVVHAMKEGEGMSSVFHAWVHSWDPSSKWITRKLTLPNRSQVIYAGGSGANIFAQYDYDWAKSSFGGTSRGVYSAFIDGLKSGRDPYSGGAPQLGGLFRKGGAKEFGVVYSDKVYFRGLQIEPISQKLEWFNELFERSDPTTRKRLVKAQRHSHLNQLIN